MSGSKKLSDSIKIGIFRWWFAGAVFFFIGFGTSLGQSSSVDLMFVLSLVLGLGTAFVFNPIIYRVFDVKDRGRVINAEYFSRSLLLRVLYDILEVMRSFIIVALIWGTYTVLNIAINAFAGNSPDTVVLGVVWICLLMISVLLKRVYPIDPDNLNVCLPSAGVRWMVLIMILIRQ